MTSLYLHVENRQIFDSLIELVELTEPMLNFEESDTFCAFEL